MYTNQLQELAQRSCFNLPSYASIREGPSKSPTAKDLDETGICKNLLQEMAHSADLKLPIYTTTRSGPGHSPIFSSIVELGGVSFSGDPAKTKKKAEKNAELAAWESLKQKIHHHQQSQQQKEIQHSNEEQDVSKFVLPYLKHQLEEKEGHMNKRIKVAADHWLPTDLAGDHWDPNDMQMVVYQGDLEGDQPLHIGGADHWDPNDMQMVVYQRDPGGDQPQRIGGAAGTPIE